MPQSDITLKGEQTTFIADVRTLAMLALVPAIGLGIARFSYALILPAMSSELGWSYADAGWMTSVNAAGYLIAALLSASAIRIAGARRVMLAGILACVIALTLMGLFRATAMLNLSWFLAGLGGLVRLLLEVLLLHKCPRAIRREPLFFLAFSMRAQV